MSIFVKNTLASKVKELAQPLGAQYVEHAFAGNANAAERLYMSIDSRERGEVAVLMWLAKVPVEAFRAFFNGAWDHDHQFVINAAGSRRRLASMFRYAAFAIPDSLPEMLTIWRGTSGIDLLTASSGYSWTLDRDMACWFAMRYAGRNTDPLVLTARVPKQSIALFHNERSESEVVLLRPPVTAAVDGYVDDWESAYQRKEEEIRQHRNSKGDAA